ncbi:MAG: transglycosylase SLT domain-containing protein [Betaproteobacteria bacterium]|nr:transglycosylase SLT domain-containing protein [Betaproteobacteria bacterium]
MRADERFDSLIQFYWQEAARAFGFDAAADWRLVKAQIHAESDFDPQARSPVGALGLMQLMTAADLEDDSRRDADNPEEAIREGIKYLGRLWREWKAEQGLERWKFALASYNAGLGNILKAQALAEARGRPTDQWVELALVLPEVTGPYAAETTGYVRRIIAEYLASRITEAM